MRLSVPGLMRPARLLDPYVYPGTDVLINKLNIRDQLLLNDIEFSFINKALIFGISRGDFDLTHLKNIHKTLFGEVYTWAGQIRSVDISKGYSTFCRYDYIEVETIKLLNSLAVKDNYLTIYKDKNLFIEKLADYYCEMNVIHPFREGNGRTTRVFFEQLAEHNGYSLDFSNITKEQWVEAAIEGFNCDNNKLESILSNALQPLINHKNYQNIIFEEDYEQNDLSL